VYQPDTTDPGQWIRQWRKFSQGLADRPYPYDDQVFEHEGRAWHGCPVALCRLLPGYHQVGDTVLCFGHVPQGADMWLTYKQAQQFTPEDWLQYSAHERRDWTSAIDPGSVSRIQSIGADHSVSAYLERAQWNISRACLALPIELHVQRRQELQAQGQWFEWQDHPDIGVRCVSGSDSRFHQAIQQVMRG